MPANETKRFQWIKALNRKTLPKQVFVCSNHFLDGAPTEQNPFPKLNLGYECQTTPGRRKLSRQEPESRKRKRLLEESSSTETCVNISQTEGGPSSSELLPEAFCDFNVVNPPTASVGTQYVDSDYMISQDHMYSKPWSDTQNTFTQTNTALTEEKGVQVKIESSAMSAKISIVTDSDSLLYTGVSKEVFFTLAEVMSEVNTFKFQLEVADQLLLVLMKLKLNLLFDDLARRFGISKSLASKMFNAWMPVLAEKLKDLVAWLPRETIRACCPESFRENYPRTTVIIDCAETFIQRPTNLKTRSETFSNYKSHNTAKYLVGISPHTWTNHDYAQVYLFPKLLAAELVTSLSWKRVDF
ncbi:Hypothetical predicted protein [Mytilus galloprovincialis]|uniref:THAP-type domain-containing protein n=1 Tax=Mytilus galloprovincialis TaxID=29158 RepID=A0A8B6FC72_MYTGA|nr:Hypothetical predicted protein [Mytilus galloprovincialis]